MVPFFADLDSRRLQWQHPVLEHVDQTFKTRPGLGMLVLVQPYESLEDALPLSDVTNLLQCRCVKAQYVGNDFVGKSLTPD